MKAIVCHAGAMSGRADGPKVAVASAVIASGTVLSKIKRHHRPESLMMRQFPKKMGQFSTGEVGCSGNPAQPELDRQRVSESWVEKIGEDMGVAP
jgi:hypothetical protein